MGMMMREKSNQMARFRIDPLIDGFMAKDMASLFFSEFACDDFRGPFEAKPGFDLMFEGLGFKAFFAAAMLEPGSGDKLGMERMVMLPSEVAAEFSGKGSMRPSQGAGDGPQRFAPR